MELKTRGFALFSRPQGEADRWVRFFTLQAGLVRASVRGVRKQGSKLASSLELWTESELVLVRRENRDLTRLIQARLLSSHAELKGEFSSIALLQVVADAVERSLPEGEPHPEVYALILELLRSLGEARDVPERERLVASFVLHLLDRLGYPLETGRCVECGTSLERRAANWVPHRGGTLCPDCSPGSAGLRLSPTSRAIVEKLKEWPLRKVLILQAGPEVSRSIFKTVLGYLEQILEEPLKTTRYYLQMIPVNATQPGSAG